MCIFFLNNLFLGLYKCLVLRWDKMVTISNPLLEQSPLCFYIVGDWELKDLEPSRIDWNIGNVLRSRLRNFGSLAILLVPFLEKVLKHIQDYETIFIMNLGEHEK